MEVIVLAAGYATRLYPLTENQPKPLLQVGSSTILERLLEKIQDLNSVNRVSVVTNDKFYNHFCQWKEKRQANDCFEITIVNDMTKSNDDRLGAIGDIKYTIDKGGINDDILVLGGDNIFEFDINDFIQFAKEKDETVCAFYDIKDIEMASLYGVAALNAEKEVTDFDEKPSKPKSTLISTCVYYFPKKRLNLFDEYFSSSEPKDATGNCIRWIAQKYVVYGYAFDEKWYDIGDKESLRVADEEYKEKEKGIIQ